MSGLTYRLTALCVLLVFALASSGFAQTGSAQLGGIVLDPSKALIPGVTVTATNADTNVTVTTVTNESGAYSFPVLQPGTYTISAALPGFKKETINKLNLPYAGQVRQDFTLQVGTASETVEVTITADSILRESSASVGDVLTRTQIENLPLVGNNILDLLATLPGLRSSALGTAFDTVNGLGTNSINATRDGMSINDTRNPAEIYGTRVLSQTILLPDLVGEVRMILAPVDAELGRGNSQIQISTRSGTNRYTGSASWNVRNSALDANTWANNHTPFTDPFSGQSFNSTPATWNNAHQYTIAYGGPIKIPGIYDGKNKTFFYGLWEQSIRNTRDLVSTVALTDTARLGIYRYWSGYNPLGWNPSSTLAAPTYPQTVTSATLISVDQNGKPVRPVADPTSPTSNPTAAGFIPYSGNLTCFSVFGTMRLDGKGGMVPFTTADCPGGNAVLPTGQAAWDKFRPSVDSTGLIQKFLDKTPRATYFGAGDGLNIGQIRWVRGRKGTNDAVNGLIGTVNLANNKQFNLKIDHNFSSNHKVAVSWTKQIDDSADNAPGYPDGIFGKLFRRPQTLTINGTSTLTSRLFNEARFGVNYTLNQDAPPWESPDADIKSKARELLLPASNSVRSPSFQYLGLVSSGLGNVSTANGYMATTAAGNYQVSQLLNWADTVSYSSGKHSYKFGVDWRLPRTSGTGANQAYPTVTLGNASGTATPSPFTTTATFNTATDTVGYLPGLLNAAATGATAARTNVTSLLQYLNGSVASASQNYWITNSKNVTDGYWDDISTNGLRIRRQISQEMAIFAKDDYKITRRLTLNLGLRWEYYASPYIEGGFTSAFVGYGYGAFGPTRTAQATLSEFNSDPFKYFLHPGNLYLSGYGSNSANPLSCKRGIQQNALLPASTCDPDSLATIQFVGPGTPNPNTPAVPTDYKNIGPAVGFAYSVPWFGEGKTTIRGGYQQTFGSAGQNRSALNGGTESTLANAPGVVTSGTLAGHINEALFQGILATRALNLGDIKSLVPVAPNQAKPGQPLTIYGGVAGPGAGVSWNVYDPNLKTPYTQNVTLSVTHQVNRKFTVDMRYTGTLGRRQRGSLDINQNNVYYNPELFQALTDTRAGTCTANAPGYAENYTSKGINPCDVNGDPVLLDQLLAGLNLNANVAGATGTGTYGAVGTVNTAGIFQSGAQHLRRNATFQNNLSWGAFDAVADALIALAPTTAQGRQNLPIDPATGVPISVIAQTGLRNGCDRLGNGYTIVQQTAVGGTQVASSGGAIPLRCFPEDWLHANPQFGFTAGSSVIYNTNTARSSYNSLQVQLTARPAAGISTQATWVWAKSFSVPGSGYVDPANRNINYGVQSINPHSLRMNGTIELPIGPNKIFFGNSSGWFARAIERWQTSFIFNAASGTPSTFNPGQSHFYAPSGYDVVSSKWVLPTPHVTWDEGLTTGKTYGNGYVGVTDPSCYDPTIVTMGDKMGTVLGRIGTGATATGPCTIFALAERKPDGTAGDILLQYPAPGKIGSLGRQNIQYFGQWSFDMSASKSFRVGESRTFQIRVDSTNVLNHPVPNLPTLGASNFGGITGKGAQTRSLQGQMRLSF